MHKITADCVNQTRLSAFAIDCNDFKFQALGNHEFDYGVNGLVPFLNAINFPIVAANLNISASHPLQETHALGRSVVFNVKNFKVGVIGYLLPETQTLSKTDDVGFISEIDAIKYVTLFTSICVENIIEIPITSTFHSCNINNH